MRTRERKKKGGETGSSVAKSVTIGIFGSANTKVQLSGKYAGRGYCIFASDTGGR